MQQTQSQSERDMIIAAVQGLLDANWPTDSAVARSEDPAAIGAIWAEMTAQGFADIGTDPELGGLSAAVAVSRLLGRAGCPAPFISQAVAGLTLQMTNSELLQPGVPLAVAFGEIDGDSNAGGVRFVDGRLTGSVRFVEDAAVARTLIVATADGVALVDLDVPGVAVVRTPGLAVPALADIGFENAVARHVAVDGAKLRDAAAIARLLLAARAEGAARRAFDSVVAYVQERVQFGQPLARFQSMQHKLADGMLALDSALLLIEAAALAFDGGSDWRFQADAAIAFASGQLRRTSLETHHAFGAIGYAEEHEAPRHFRRVHADLARMGGQTRARAALAEHMLAGDAGGFPRRDLGEEAETFRQTVKDWLARNWTDADRAAEREQPFHQRGWNSEFDRKLGADGWLDLAWPEEVGGQGLSPLCQLALVEELALAGAPTGSMSASTYLIGPEIIRHGSSWLRETFLPGIRAGEIRFALGYSEPQAGSDLTSLRTRAERDGDYYIINGQKLWGTGTEHATHIALAVRTDPEAKSKAQGISVILVPTDLPGIVIQPDMALYGHSFCTQFFDNVRVPAEYLLGHENGGWAILTGALAAERILMGGNIIAIQKLFEDLCGFVSEEADLRDDRRVRDIIGQFASEIDAARQLSLNSVRVLESGRLPLVEGAMTKVFSGDLTERFTEAALDVLGTRAILGEDATGTPLDGRIEQTLRRSIMLVIGGGAAEIQKTLIAQRGLGLPR